MAKNWNHRDPSVVDNGDYAELMSIAVSPNAQGVGIGKQLIQKTDEVIKSLNAERNLLTIGFYKNESTFCFLQKVRL